MFEALGRVMYRRRRWVVALTLAFVAFAGVWGTGVFGAHDRRRVRGPRQRELARRPRSPPRELGRDGADVVVLYRSDDLTVDDPAFAGGGRPTASTRCPTTSSRSRRPSGRTGAASWSATTGTSTYAVLSWPDGEDQEATASS